jgi:hypothetical protein
MKKRVTSVLKSIAVILGAAFLTVLACSGLLIYFDASGMNEFIPPPWMATVFQWLMTYLGSAIFFFVPVLTGYVICFVRLKQSLSTYRSDLAQAEKIRFYSGAMEILTTLFFAIGVIFTAWGLQNALVSALEGLGRTEASRLGAWGILKRLVDNGILIALWTTIVGGTGGYLMRVGKYFFLAKDLNRYVEWREGRSESILADGLESLRRHVEGIEQSIRAREETAGTSYPQLTVREG